MQSEKPTEEVFNDTASTSIHSAVEKKDTGSDKAMKKLLCVTAVCAIFCVVELIGGIISGSLAILTDSAHMFTDVASFGISAFAVYLGKKPATKSLTYGYNRSEVIGAMLSIFLIWGLIAWLFVEAIYRVMNPQPIDAAIMLMTATLGLLFNIFSAIVLNGWAESADEDLKQDKDSESYGTLEDKPEEKENINVKAAAIHVLGDVIQSAGVIMASLIIYYNPTYLVADPSCTFIFTLLVICTTIPITQECTGVLMEGAPADIDVNDIIEDLKNVGGVVKVHDCHVWQISVGKNAFSAHIDSDTPFDTLRDANKLIRDKYEITHSTIQVEPASQKAQYGIECDNDIHE